MKQYWIVLVLGILCFSCRNAEYSEQTTLQFEFKEGFSQDFEAYSSLHPGSQPFYELTTDSLQNLLTFNVEEPSFHGVLIYSQYLDLYLEKGYHLTFRKGRQIIFYRKRSSHK